MRHYSHLQFKFQVFLAKPTARGHISQLNVLLLLRLDIQLIIMSWWDLTYIELLEIYNSFIDAPNF